MGAEAKSDDLLRRSAAPRKKGVKGKLPLYPHQPFEQGLIEPGGVLLNPLFGLQALL